MLAEFLKLGESMTQSPPPSIRPMELVLFGSLSDAVQSRLQEDVKGSIWKQMERFHETYDKTLTRHPWKAFRPAVRLPIIQDPFSSIISPFVSNNPQLPHHQSLPPPHHVDLSTDPTSHDPKHPQSSSASSAWSSNSSSSSHPPNLFHTCHILRSVLQLFFLVESRDLLGSALQLILYLSLETSKLSLTHFFIPAQTTITSVAKKIR